MNAAGRMDIAALDMQFSRNPIFGPDGAPLAGAGGDQKLVLHWAI